MIETIVSMPAVSISLFVVGVVCGAVVASIVLPSRREIDRLTGELTALKSEHESYKGHVTTHFLKTSELVANMTASYKAVYDHLASGAQSLCSDTEALEAPKFGSPKLIFDPTIEFAEKHAPTPEPDVAEAEVSAETSPETAAEGEPAPQAARAPDDAEPGPETAPEQASKTGDWRMESADASAEEDAAPAPDPATPERDRTGENA